MPISIYPVLLAGGASSRLWPLSDAAHPKWDLRLFGGETLLEQTWARAQQISGAARQNFIVAGQAHVQRIEATLGPLGLAADNLLVEPEARDTSGALAFALGRILKQDRDAVLLVLPGDHLIAPLEAFAQSAQAAAALAVQQQALVTFGIVPTFAATSYGYLHRGAELKIAGFSDARGYEVRAFKEKPDLATAEGYVKSGAYYWNGGIFAFPAALLLAEFEKQMPGHAAMIKELIAAPAAQFGEAAAKHFPKLQKTSIDFGIMERAAKVATVAASFSWDDIGSWSAIKGHIEQRGGNAVGARVDLDAHGAQGNVVLAPGRRVALIGVQNVAVIDGHNGLLVCDLAQDQLVKNVATRKAAVKSYDIEAPSQGRTITALIAEPPKVSGETGVMLVMHGYGNSRRQYAAWMEEWAARYDLVCVSPEYRDSGFDADPSGKGARQPYDFSHLQLADCLNAFRAARLKFPQADGKRTLVWGGSQGGHMALLAAEFAPNSFAACFDLCGVAHPIENPTVVVKHYWSEAEFAIRDARRWTDNVRCPVVLAHGTADDIVSDSHTREVCSALANAGKDFSVKFVPGGDHFLLPGSTRKEVSEQLGEAYFRFARRGGEDDFETKQAYEFKCPGGVTYRLDFASGLALWTQK